MPVNPNYDASVANPTALLRYLTDQRITLSESELMTFDFIAQGTLPSISFDAGEAAWAAGYERRDYNLKTSTPARAGPTATNAMTNIHNGDLYPCLIPEQNETAAGRAACAANPVGLFMFLAPTFDSDQDQDVDALFAELALPVSDQLDVQLAIRYEDYGTVDSIDPKVVVRFSPTDTVTLRFTGQTTFRAPHPDETSRTRVTALQYVNQTGAFKAVDLTGNTNLEPEEATTYNIGLITDFGTDNWTATLDYYNFEFDNPIINENHQQLANAYGAGGAGKAAIQSQIFGGTNLVNDGSFGVGDIARIQSNYVNGPKTETDGLDLFIKYDTDVGNGTLSTGLEANAILGYSVADYNVGGALVAAAYECAGFFNINNTCRPMPEQKGKGFVNYVDAKHNFYGAVNYISSYYNRRDSGRVAEHRTFDATYTYSMNDSTDLSFSVYNIADKLPPFVNWEMNYDAYTHSPLGRFVKAGFTYRLQ
jgi:iron complex outermembrane receptor protein